MRKKILQIIIVLVAMCQTAVFAQTGPVTGKVVGADNQPVAGASVTVSGTKQGTVTDANGNFSIVTSKNASLLIQSIGFADQVVSVGGKSVINLTLVSGQSTGLEEVVVTGYTSQKKKDIVGAVSIVDVKTLKATPSSSVMNALQGQAAGVDVINNGSPGQQSQIFIRGITTIAGSNQPLVLIDGIRGSINDIPSNDVESIQVLKDAGSAAIYGASGANGVIVVTTKKGKSGAPSVTYDSYYNLQLAANSKKWNLMSSKEWYDTYYTLNPDLALFPNGTTMPDYFYRYQGPSGPVRGAANEGNPVVDPSKYKFDPNNYLNNYIIAEVNKEGTDMIGSISNPALQMNQSVTLSGGNDRATYMLALGYLDHQGTIDNSYLKRYTTRINTEFKVRPGIRIGQNLNLYYKNNPQFSANGGFGPIISAASHIPLIPIYDIGGNYAGPFIGPGNFLLGDWGNERATVDLTNNNRFRQFGIVGNVYAEVDLFKHFTVRSSFGGFIDQNYRQQFDYAQYWKASGGGNSNTLTELSTITTRMQWTNTLNYNQQFGKHTLNVNLGTESIDDKSRGLQANASQFFSTDFAYLVLANAENRTNPAFNSASSVVRLYSQFGRVDYNYNEKYLVALTLRRDGSSLFGAGNQWGYFPSVSVGWRLSNEEFMKNISWLNDLKIRSSYGVLGNTANIDARTAYTTYGQNSQRSYYDIAGAGTGTIARGFFPATNGNQNVQWEQDEMFNVGFDATFFNNKFSLSAEYYKKKMSKMLFQIGTPATAGEANPPAINVGDLQNVGFDVAATYRTNVSRDFGISAALNFTTYNNKIIDIPGAPYRDAGSQIRFEEGYDAGSLFGYVVQNVFVDQKEVDEAAVQSDKAPGRYRYVDQDGNDTINSLDRVHYGSVNPDFTIGLNLAANYKNFDFSAQFYASLGNDTYNNTYEFLGAWERGQSQKSRMLLDAWTPTNTVTNVKKNEVGRNFSNTGVVNSAWAENGSFLRLRNIQIGYNLSSPGLTKLGMRNIRFYVQGTNLFLLDDYSGIDPEVYSSGLGGRGIDAGGYAAERAIGLGLNVTF